MSDSALARLLEHLPGPDTVSQAAVAERAATTLRPAGAFGRLDAEASWLAVHQVAHVHLARVGAAQRLTPHLISVTVTA